MKNSSAQRRVFVGIPLTANVGSVITMLRTVVDAPPEAIRWVSGKNLHLTLLFLGNLEDSRISVLNERLAHSLTLDTFSVTLAGTGVFPTSTRPRVLWLGFDQGREKLIQLATQVQQAAATIVNSGHDSEYIPHVTIGRVRKQVKPWKINLESYLKTSYEPIKFTVFSVFLYESELLPAGPRYSVLKEFKLP